MAWRRPAGVSARRGAGRGGDSEAGGTWGTPSSSWLKRPNVHSRCGAAAGVGVGWKGGRAPGRGQCWSGQQTSLTVRNLQQGFGCAPGRAAKFAVRRVGEVYARLRRVSVRVRGWSFSPPTACAGSKGKWWSEGKPRERRGLRKVPQFLPPPLLRWAQGPPRLGSPLSMCGVI